MYAILAKGDILKLKKKWSKAFAIILALMLCVSGIMVPEFSAAEENNTQVEQPNEKDKSALINKTLTSTIKQDGKEISEEGDINLDKTFNITMTFAFPTIKDSLIGKPQAGGINKNSEQVDKDDFANFDLGKNFKLTDDKNNKIPVLIYAPGDVLNGEKIGTIQLTKDASDGSLKATMKFDADFNYEQDPRLDLTVKFTGKFSIDKDHNSEPGDENKTVSILGKNYKVKETEEKLTYDFKKFGEKSAKDEITWTCNVKKTSNKGPTTLGGEVFADDLTKVGEYKKDSFTVNGVSIPDNEIIKGNTIKYTFPKDFNKGNATIKFTTKIIPEYVENNEVKNKSALGIKDETINSNTATVKVRPDLTIKKNLIDLKEDKDNNEKSLIWTIEAGAPFEDYGPVWIGDILSGHEGQKPPKRVDLTYEYSLNGKDWSTIDAYGIKKKELSHADAPKLPTGKSCPELSKYKDNTVYEIEKNWLIKDRKKDGKSVPLEDHWVFLKDLNGMYRITVIAIYDMDEVVGPLRNDAEIHHCSDQITPIKQPSVYSGIGTIDKVANTSDVASINQGIIPWIITPNFTKVFPSEKRCVYECFYYGSRENFIKDRESKNIKVEGTSQISEDVFDHLLYGGKKEEEKSLNEESKSTYFSFKQAYYDEGDKIKAEIPNDNFGKTPQEPKTLERQLTREIIKLTNKNGKQIGEIVKITGLDEKKPYTFTLKTRPQDIANNLIDKFKEKPDNEKPNTNSSSMSYKNTAVMAVGEGDTFKTIPAKAPFTLRVNLLKKNALSFDSTLKIVEGGNSPLSVSESSAFNYKNRTVLFRIDVNPQGLKLGDYIKQLKPGVDEKPEIDFTKLEIKDTLPEGLKLSDTVENKGQGNYYIYEAKPASYVDGLSEPTKLLATTDSLVAFKQDGKTLTWNFDNYNGNPYIIVFRTELSDAKYKDLIRKAELGKPIVFRNEASLKAGGKKLAESESSPEIKPNILSKYRPSANSDNKDKLDWTFEYRPYGVRLTKMCFLDKLDDNIGLPLNDDGSIDLTNFKIRRGNNIEPGGYYSGELKDVMVVKGTPSDGQVKVSYDPKEHTIRFDLPNTPSGIEPYYYEFKYSTIPRPKDLDKKVIKNTVQLTSTEKKLIAESSLEIQTSQYEAFATIDRKDGYRIIKKVDENGNPLAGAVFEYKDKNGKLIKTVTDKDGQICIVNMDKDNPTELTELKAPEGYQKLSNPVKIDPSKINIKDPIIVRNHKIYKPHYINIDVTKRWVGDKASERPDDITVTLIKDGVLTDKTLTLNEDNNWKGTFRALPPTDGHGHIIEYTVSETRIPNYDASISGNKYSGFVITNSKTDEPGNPPSDEGTKPKDPNKGGRDGLKNSKNPGTGDNTSLYAWGITALISALGYVFLRRKVN